MSKQPTLDIQRLRIGEHLEEVVAKPAMFAKKFWLYIFEKEDEQVI